MPNCLKAPGKKANGAGSVLAFESFGQKDQDFSVQLTKIIASGAEMLYLPCYYNFVGLIVPQAQELGWDGVVFGADAWGLRRPLETFQRCREGILLHTTHYAAAGAKGETKEFIDAYEAAYGYTPDDVGALTYDAVNIVLTAIHERGTDRRS